MNTTTESPIITVNKKEIVTLVKEMPISDLKFWTENPRVNSALKRKYGTVDVEDEKIQTLLWDEDHVKDLYQEIKNHGGLIDEILVRDNTVLEGNSRLCAYRMLHHKAQQANNLEEIQKWSKIRARVLPSETSEDEIFTILGTWHIKGKKQWDTFEKAAYLKRMNTDFGHSFQEIADMIGESKSFIENNIAAHDMMIQEKVYELNKFSYFFEFVKNKKITQIVAKEPTLHNTITEAIKDNRISRAEEIRDLPKILTDKVAKREFVDEGVSLKEALDTSKDRHPEYDDAFYNQIKRTTKLLKECPLSKIEEIKADDKKLYYFKMLRKSTEQIARKLKLDK